MSPLQKPFVPDAITQRVWRNEQCYYHPFPGMLTQLWSVSSFSVVAVRCAPQNLWVSYTPSHSNLKSSFPSITNPPTESLELRILDLLEALDAPLHLLRRLIIAPLRVLVDVQFVMLAFARVLALHDVLAQNLGDGLHVLDRIVLLRRARLEVP